jgi:hypothetical protein
LEFSLLLFQAKYVNSLLDSRLVAIGVASTENGDHNSTTTTANNDDFSDENNPPGKNYKFLNEITFLSSTTN